MSSLFASTFSNLSLFSVFPQSYLIYFYVKKYRTLTIKNKFFYCEAGVSAKPEAAPKLQKKQTLTNIVLRTISGFGVYFRDCGAIVCFASLVFATRE